MTFSVRQRLPSLSHLAWAVAACVLAASPGAGATASDELKAAKNNFEFGDFAKTVQLLSALPDIAVLPLESERIEAYRLLGLAEFFLGHKPQAENAFFGLLKQNPEFTLDPFYVPPDAVAFFDDVKRRNEEYLAPIRERRRARIREQQAEEAARREAERRRMETQRALVPPTIVIEQKVRENSRLVAWMPLGLGQIQNGQGGAGAALAVSQVLLGATSMFAFAAVESLRDESSGRFVAGNYETAKTFDTVKFITGGLFYLLWIGGAIEANVNYEPVVTLGESTRVPGAAPPQALTRPPPPTPAPAPASAPAPAPASAPAPAAAPAPEDPAPPLEPPTPLPSPQLPAAPVPLVPPPVVPVAPPALVPGPIGADSPAPAPAGETTAQAVAPAP